MYYYKIQFKSNWRWLSVRTVSLKNFRQCLSMNLKHLFCLVILHLCKCYWYSLNQKKKKILYSTCWNFVLTSAFSISLNSYRHWFIFVISILLHQFIKLHILVHFGSALLANCVMLTNTAIALHINMIPSLIGWARFS